MCVYDEADGQRIEGVEVFVQQLGAGGDDNAESDYTMRLVETEIDKPCVGITSCCRTPLIA